MVNYEYDHDLRVIVRSDDGERKVITHSLEYRLDSRFEIFLVNGDEKESLETNNRSSDYILYWLRENLRKLENGIIKVIGPSSQERKWKKEEEIRNHLWRNIKTTEELIKRLDSSEYSLLEDGYALFINCPISYKSHLGVTICTEVPISHTRY